MSESPKLSMFDDIPDSEFGKQSVDELLEQLETPQDLNGDVLSVTLPLALEIADQMIKNPKLKLEVAGKVGPAVTAYARHTDSSGTYTIIPTSNKRKKL